MSNNSQTCKNWRHSNDENQTVWQLIRQKHVENSISATRVRSWTGQDTMVMCQRPEVEIGYNPHPMCALASSIHHHFQLLQPKSQHPLQVALEMYLAGTVSSWPSLPNKVRVLMDKRGLYTGFPENRLLSMPKD